MTARPAEVQGVFSFWSERAGLRTLGKGLSAEQARASAVFEQLERSSWRAFDYRSAPGHELVSHATLAARGAATVAPDWFLRNMIAPELHQGLQEAILTTPQRHVAAWSLTHERPLAYPIAWHNLTQTSNGLAAGSRREEAILQGLCEVLEREAVWSWFVERRPPRDLDQGSVRHPLTRAVLAEAARLGVRFAIKDLSPCLLPEAVQTVDLERETAGGLGIACFSVQGVFDGPDGPVTHFSCGQGCHPDPEKALIRALSEYLASHDVLRRGPDGRPASHPAHAPPVHPEQVEASAGLVRMDQLEDLAAADIAEELRLVIGRLADRGREVAVVDKTHPRLGLPVVRVLVPGLRALIGAETRNARLVLAAVCQDAGDTASCRRHLMEGLRDALSALPGLRALTASPLVAGMLPFMLQRIDTAAFFGHDYLEALERYRQVEGKLRRALGGGA